MHSVEINRRSGAPGWVAAACLVAAVCARPSAGQVSPTDIEYLQEEGEAEGWTFSVGQNAVTSRPLENLCGLQEPEGWQNSARVSPFHPPINGQLALPAAFDWREQNGCTPVKNQGGCGSCWAFATVGVLECSILIRDGLTVDLSEQYLVSCNYSNWSCSGGWFAHDYHWDTAGRSGGVGAVLEAAKPYTATNATCGGPFLHPYRIDSWSYVGTVSGVPATDAIKQAIMAYGPVAAAVYVNNAFQAYSGGVFNAGADSAVNHAIVLVGWDDADQAWILRNSWGTGWGESGYMRIRYGTSRVGYAACYVDYGEDTTTAAAITSPASGSTFTGSEITFTWDAYEGATEYWLTVGTAANKANIYSKSAGTDTSATVDRIHTDGRAIYVKLFTKVDGQWYARIYTYKAANLPASQASMTSPADGSTFDSSTVTFEWDDGNGRPSEFYLSIGNARGKNNYYAKSQGTSRSVTVSNLPMRGKPVYVRLWSKIAGTWRTRDYTYTAAASDPVAAEMTSPENSSTLSGTTATFQWTQGTGVTQYKLQIGNSVGAYSLCNRSVGTSRTATVTNLPADGRTLYVRLWSACTGVWEYNDYTYTAVNSVKGPAEMTSPANGATLESNSGTFQWSAGTKVTQYKLNIGTTLGGTNLYSKSLGTSLSALVTTLPTNGRTVYVRLWSLIGSTWYKRDYTYTSATMATAPAEMISPAGGSSFASSLVTFTWSAGTGVSEYKLSIGTSAGGTNLYSKSQGTSQSVTVGNLPTSGATVYVRLSSKISTTWYNRDYTYTSTITNTSTAAEMVSPASGSSLTSSQVTFEWSAGVGVTEYKLTVGTTPGGTDLYSQSLGNALTAVVSNLPTNGVPVYARLSSRMETVWYDRDYVYTAMTSVATLLAEMVSPEAGTVLDSASVTFSWTAGVSVTEYWLKVGTAPGRTEYYNQSTGTARSVTVNGLPTDGRTVYVRLWSKQNGAWQYIDYSYTTGG